MLRVLHVASFTGNIGDNLNHAGSYRMLRRHLGAEFEVSEWEIREYFWRKAHFDEDFATLCNEHDFVLFGGGNYFELWVERSVSGTSVDIPPDVLRKIKVPMVFHSLGFDAGQGYTEKSLEKTRSYFETLLERKSTFISLRNDGSMKTAQSLLGSEIASHIHPCPDGGFFAGDPEEGLPGAKGGRRIIGVNIAGDMLSRRFGEDPLAAKGFFQEFVKFVEVTTETHPDIRFRLFPHIFRDFQPITELLDLLSDSVRRRRVEIAPLLVGKESVQPLLRQYGECSLVLGNRFHANVGPVGLGVPTLGLINYPQVRFLYEELGLVDRGVDVTMSEVGGILHDQVEASLSGLPALKERYSKVASDVCAKGEASYSLLGDWLRANISR